MRFLIRFCCVQGPCGQCRALDTQTDGQEGGLTILPSVCLGSISGRFLRAADRFWPFHFLFCWIGEGDCGGQGGEGNHGASSARNKSWYSWVRPVGFVERCTSVTTFACVVGYQLSFHTRGEDILYPLTCHSSDTTKLLRCSARATTKVVRLKCLCGGTREARMSAPAPRVSVPLAHVPWAYFRIVWTLQAVPHTPGHWCSFTMDISPSGGVRMPSFKDILSSMSRSDDVVRRRMTVAKVHNRLSHTVLF
jgi:hypothetical protein